MALKKTIGNFEVKAYGEGLITVYKDGEIMKAMTVTPSQLEEKFKTVCESVEKHVNKDI